jgi:hypothetical protein
MICGFSLGSMLQFLLLSEMLCIPVSGDDGDDEGESNCLQHACIA